ncbi:hypothetical protein HG530_005616 [Fusarium avenaceum]|nr:hypothetical protein HG530_005616 [Fusarium avenaceum]
MWFILKNIQTRAGKLSALESLHKISFVDEFSTCNVDQFGALLHFCQTLLVQKCLTRERRSDNNAVCLGEEGIGRLVKHSSKGLFNLPRHLSNVVVEDLHVESLVGLLCDAATNATEADDAEAETAGVA